MGDPGDFFQGSTELFDPDPVQRGVGDCYLIAVLDLFPAVISL